MGYYQNLLSLSTNIQLENQNCWLKNSQNSTLIVTHNRVIKWILELYYYFNFNQLSHLQSSTLMKGRTRRLHKYMLSSFATIKQMLSKINNKPLLKVMKKFYHYRIDHNFFPPSQVKEHSCFHILFIKTVCNSND